MKRKMKKLTAVGELRLHTMAREGWRYLQSVCGESDDQEWERQLWAVANNAALVALSTSYLGSPIFTSARQVLDELDLTQIVRLVQEYQRRFEEVAR
jgi:hypothetical protein